MGARNSFNLGDSSGDGELSPDELREMVYKRGHYLSDDDLQQVMEDLDTNGDGSISFTEFWKFVDTSGDDAFSKFKKFQQCEWTTWVADWFMEFDKDRQGKVEREHFQKVYCALAECNDWLQDTTFEEVLEEVDADSDGFVSINEFIDWYYELCINYA